MPFFKAKTYTKNPKKNLQININHWTKQFSKLVPNKLTIKLIHKSFPPILYQFIMYSKAFGLTAPFIDNFESFASLISTGLIQFYRDDAALLANPDVEKPIKDIIVALARDKSNVFSSDNYHRTMTIMLILIKMMTKYQDGTPLSKVRHNTLVNLHKKRL